VASSRSRQRKLARARYDRQMARKAAAIRRRRQIQAAVGASLALLLIVVGAVWLLGGFSGEKKPAAAPATCEWTPQNASANDKLKDVGKPPTKDLPTSGTAEMMVSTNQGVINVALDVAKAPCAAASFTYLANQGFFGNTECHQLLTGTNGSYALRCGDPSGTGSGGPTYTFYDENVPSAPAPDPSDPSASASAGTEKPLYPKGTVAMATDTPGLNGSQFFVFYQDSRPDTQYSIVGTVTSGLDVVEKVAKAGTVDNGSGAKTKPKLGVKIQNLTVTGPASPSAATSGSPGPSGAPASGSPSATSSTS
jgi:peptidyl-prolyl cis-trans isomerase B (cyclophilin B)